MTEPHTHILDGAARALSITAERSDPGVWLRAATVSVEKPVAYRQWSEWCTLNVTVQRTFSSAEAGRTRAPGDEPGAVSFRAPMVEHFGTARCGTIAGTEIGMDPQLISELCEQRLEGSWQASSDTQDGRAYVIVSSVVRHLQESSDPLLIDTLMVMCARHLGKAYGAAAFRRDDAWLHPAALGRVIERIRTGPEDPPALAELAGLAGLGVSAFLRGFRGSVGLSPATFSRRARIEHARHMLERSDRPLSEIAAMTGFASVSHLISSFRAQLGSTPAAWRRATRTIRKSA